MNGEFEVRAWDKETFLESEGGRKLTRANVTQAFSGGIAGTGMVQWLMCYQPDGTAARRSAARRGIARRQTRELVLETSGDFDGSEASGTWLVIPGSGTGKLGGLRGNGHFTAP